jgi:CBS domain-containing protein
MHVRDIMITDFPMISLHASVGDAVRILHKNFGDESYMNAAPGLVVVNENGELTGVLSPLTILRALGAEANETGRPRDENPGFYTKLCGSIKGKRVMDIMDWQAISVTEDARLLDVADLFVANRFQRIPVVRDGKVVGVIYRSRLLFALAESLLA